MKKDILYILFSLAIILSVVGCKSASRSYKKGNYYDAVIESVDKLRSKPNNEEAQDILVKAYPLAKSMSLRSIDNALNSNNLNKYEILVQEYQRLNKLSEYIYLSPKAIELIPNPQSYYQQLDNAKQLAAEALYNQGVDALNARTVTQARLALKYFNSANTYVRDYKDIATLIREATYEGTLRVIVRRPETNPRYQISADFFYDNLITEMNRINKSRMIRFYEPNEARIEGMRNPHQYINISFVDFSVGNVKETIRETEVKRDSVVVRTMEIGGKTQNIYNTVKATLREFNRSITSGGIVALNITDAVSNKSLLKRSYTGSFVWSDSWADFKGDDRALTIRQKALCDKQAQIPPDPQTMFVEFTKPIYEQIIPNIRSFYNKY